VLSYIDCTVFLEQSIYESTQENSTVYIRKHSREQYNPYTKALKRTVQSIYESTQENSTVYMRKHSREQYSLYIKALKGTEALVHRQRFIICP
jgi:hypothetical protein